MSKQQKISSGYSNAQSKLVRSSFDENKGGENPYLQFISTTTDNEENPYKQFLPKEEYLPPLISPYQERRKQQYQNAVKEATLSNIVKASKKPYGILSPQETNPLGVSDESTIRNPRNDAMDKIMQIISSPAEGTVTGLGEGLNTLVESGKQFRQGNIIAGGLGELAGLAQTGISAATPFVPTIQAFTAGQRALQEIGGGDISNVVMSPVETITQPKTFTGQNAAKLADLLYNIALFRGIDKGLEKFKGSDYENKNQTTSPVSPIEGKPALKQTEGQTEIRTPQRGSEGIQQEKAPQAYKGLKIVSTAVNDNGKILTGKDKFESHNNIGEQNGIGKPAENTRGFLVEDENGNQRFVDRKEGAKIAQESGQIEKPVEELHSEDLQKLPEKPLKYEPTLNVGFNPNIDKFYEEDIKPGIGKVKTAINATVGTIKKIPDYLNGVFQSAFPVIKKLGNEPYAEVIKGIHKPELERLNFDNAQSRIFDANFKKLESFYAKYPKNVIDDFNLTRGEPSSAEAMQLKEAASNRLPKELKNPKLQQSIKEVSDWIYNFAKQNGIDLNYFDDYFYGAYKDSKKVSKFLDYWQSTERYTKEKTLPTIADAAAWGLELKDNNPITNLRKESDAIARRAGYLDIQKYNKDTNASYMVDKTKANQEQLKSWEKINDNAFKDYLYDPLYARFVNSLISSNKLSSNLFLRGLRNLTYGLQQLKFIGSIFHFTNMAKHAIAANTGGILNPKGITDFVSAFKKYDELDPKYQEFVKLGGEHKYSIEAQSETQLTKLINKMSSGNYLGSILKIPGTVLEQKWIPATPGFIKWMFEDYIPTLKFERYKDDIAIRERQLNRPLTDGEKIASIRRIQQFYGEMNERLYGRSGTVTSAMRLFFMAPGYGEGNIRTNLSSLKGFLGKDLEAKTNLKYVANSLFTTASLAAIGTYIMTGKPPDTPKRMTDLRDVFKIKTGQKDGNGDDIYVDLMTFDKDFWGLYGNALMGQPGQMIPDLVSRFSGATSTGYKTLTDLSNVIQGRNVYDFKGTPIYYSSDTFPQKVGKFMAYELSQAQPISSSTFGFSQSKSQNLGANIATSILGVRPTTSERVREIKQVRNDIYSILDSKRNKQIELNKLAKENRVEAKKEMDKFNDDVKDKLLSMSKILGRNINPNKFLIKRFNEKASVPVESQINKLVR